MYRKRASKSALQGVLSGPYAGGSRTIDVARLPRDVRQRLADVLAYRAEPSPLLHDRPTSLARSRASWALVLSIFAFLSLTAYRLGDPRSALAIYPAAFLLVYAIPSAGLVFSLLSLVRRRARVGGDSLSPGRWLLPLDIVEVEAPDADGRQRVVVTPLGDARDAEVKVDGRRRELLISFAEAEPITFSLRADPDGEATMKRLEHAQHLLEDLTYGRHLEKAVTQDPFFAVRVDGSWKDLRVEAGAPARRERILHGRAGTLAAAGLAGVVAFTGWAGRNRASDRLLFLHAARQHTPEAYDAYLQRGTAHALLAIALRQQVLDERKAADEQLGRQRAEDDRIAALQRSPAERCVEALRARAARSHPGVTKALLDQVETGREIAGVHFATESGAFAGSDEIARLIGERQRELVRAFERVFSQSCPASVIRFETVGIPELAVIDVGVKVAPTGAPWRLAPNPAFYACGAGATGIEPCPEGGKLVVQPVTIDFDVRTRSGGAAHVSDAFHLTMPPTPAPSMTVRERSVFWIDTAAPVVAETFDTRVHASMTARAFDRLYDELHALVFEGDPVVPIREP